TLDSTRSGKSGYHVREYQTDLTPHFVRPGGNDDVATNRAGEYLPTPSRRRPQHARQAEGELAPDQAHHARELATAQPQPPSQLALSRQQHRPAGVVDPARRGRAVHPVKRRQLVDAESVELGLPE